MKYEIGSALCRRLDQASILWLIPLFLSMASTRSAAAQTATLSAEITGKIERAVTKFQETTKAPGIAVAVVSEGSYVWSAGFGMSDLENGTPSTSQTVYRIASVSKPITAVAALMLWEQHKLDLDAPIQEYCPSFPQKSSPITTRQLLGHLGGIGYYRVPDTPYSNSQSDPEVGNTRHFDNGIQGGLQFFQDDPLVSAPGKHFNYSTQGYTLVGCVIEGASGETYENYVRKHVLNPSGMGQTRPDDRRAIIPFRTRFYSQNSEGSVTHAEFLDASYKVPGGGLLSSAPDLARFSAAVLNDRLVSRATLDMMWTPQIPSDRLGRMVYGLGWQIGSIGGVTTVGHGGSQQGTSAMMLIAPEARAGIVVLINSDSVGSGTLATQLLTLVLGLPSAPPKAIKVDPKHYDKYIGSYDVSSFVVKIVREGDHLYLEINGQRNELFPESAQDFFLQKLDSKVRFVVKGNAPATELVLSEAGADIIAARIQ